MAVDWNAEVLDAQAPVVRVVLYTSVELIHHGAEICLLRDLYPGPAGLTR